MAYSISYYASFSARWGGATIRQLEAYSVSRDGQSKKTGELGVCVESGSIICFGLVDRSKCMG